MNGYWLAAIVAGVALWGLGHFFLVLLNEDDVQRKELAREGKPCQRLTRYQR